jgi:type I restriction enzyme S subunit
MKFDSWKHGRVDDFFVLQRGFDITEVQSKKGNVPVISSSGISYFHSDYKVTGPGVITGRKGKLGSVHYIEENYWPHDTTLWVKDFKGNNPRYVYYFLQNLKLEQFNEALAVPTLNRNNVHRIKCSFPSSEEQKKIVNILMLLDMHIKKTEALNAAKKKQFEWLINRLINPTNNHWNLKKLSNLSRIKKGQQLNRILLTKTDLFPAWNGGITPSGYTDTWNTPEDTVTISEGGNSCGFVNYCKEKFWCGGHCYALLDISHEIKSEFLFYFLKAHEKQIMSLRVGSGLPNIQRQDIEKLEIAYPQLSEQRKIVRILSEAQKEISILKLLADKYIHQKRGLMQKLLTGKWQIMKLQEEVA